MITHEYLDKQFFRWASGPQRRLIAVQLEISAKLIANQTHPKNIIGCREIPINSMAMHVPI